MQAQKGNHYPPMAVDVSIPYRPWEETDFSAIGLVNTGVREALLCAQASSFLRGRTCEVSVVLANDDLLQALNHEYRNKNKPTNVLSFPMDDPDEPALPGSAFHLGDIVLAYETIVREAQEQEKDVGAHFLHLVVHGTLHLLGHDHEEPGEAAIMEELEVQIMQRLGHKNPYE